MVSGRAFGYGAGIYTAQMGTGRLGLYVWVIMAYLPLLLDHTNTSYQCNILDMLLFLEHSSTGRPTLPRHSGSTRGAIDNKWSARRAAKTPKQTIANTTDYHNQLQLRAHQRSVHDVLTRSNHNPAISSYNPRHTFIPTALRQPHPPPSTFHNPNPNPNNGLPPPQNRTPVPSRSNLPNNPPPHRRAPKTRSPPTPRVLHDQRTR